MPLVSPNAKMKQNEKKSKFLTKLKDLNEKSLKGPFTYLGYFMVNQTAYQLFMGTSFTQQTQLRPEKSRFSAYNSALNT